MLRLPNNLGELAKLAARDPARYALANVRVAEVLEGYEVQATDGKRLGIVQGPGREEQPLALLADAPNGATTALIPAKAWASVFKAAKRDEPFVVLGEKVSTFAAGSNVSRVENGDGRWPAFDTILPKQRPAVEFQVNGRLLAELLAVAAAFSHDGEGSVTVRFWTKDRPVAVTTANGTQLFFGMQMPLS